ncbi:MAG: type II toxin-antitoxin system RelE/ParE family toxin [Lachnospira sp.]|nr:type II toxin-antitoxin system RelE/ParE family toxin [Lachnospira sp.]
MAHKMFTVKYTYSSKDDIRKKKEYILREFKYKGLGKRFSEKIKMAVNQLKIFPNGYETIGFQYRGYDIHLMPSQSYLLFFVIDQQKCEVIILRVLQDGQDWKYIIEQWLEKN